MRAYLVHHADAVGPEVDPQRPLSDIGWRQAEIVAQALRELNARPEAMWHSGKLRSRQTAEACLRVVNPFAQFTMIRGLHPEDPPEWLRDELAAETRDVLLVGHMPHIARLARMLSPGSDAFPLHGMMAFERREDGGWTVVKRFDVSDRS